MRSLTLLAVVGLLATVSQGATIITPITSVSSVDLTGTITYAVDLGNGDTDYPVAGVTFKGENHVPGLVVGGTYYGYLAPDLGTGADNTNLADVLLYIRYATTGTPETFTVPVTQGQAYNLQLLFYDGYQTVPGARTEDISVNGSVIASNFDIIAASPNTKCVDMSYAFTAGSSTLSIGVADGNIDPGNSIISGFILTPAPEPATLGLLALGGLALLRRKH